MVRRKKTTIFTDAKETTTVRELKRIIQGTNGCLYELHEYKRCVFEHKYKWRIQIFQYTVHINNVHEYV